MSRLALLLVLGFSVFSAAPVHALVVQRACTQEAKMCPDGSAVGRTGPNCEFAPCPGEADASPKEKENRPNKVWACTKDAKMCPDGSAVGRIPPQCEFAPCPGEGASTPPSAEDPNYTGGNPGGDDGANPDDIAEPQPGTAPGSEPSAPAPNDNPDTDGTEE